jgi:aspartate/glutamate racemase
MIQQVTFSQLVKGMFTDAARKRFTEVITRLGEDSCDAVALVCTEFPLLISPEVSPLPTLNSTDLLARAAVNAAIGGAQPTWRGGPPTD